MIKSPLIRRLLFPFLILLYFAAAKVSAQSPVSAGAYNSLLWEISGRGLEKPSYLYGTIHLIGKSDFFADSLVKDKFSTADRLLLEIKVDAPDLQMKMMQRMVMDGDTTLQILLGEDYEYVSHFMQDSLGVNLIMFNSIKPLFVATLVLPQMLGEPPASYEFYFMKLAQEKEVEIFGLETVEEQMIVFDRIPLPEQADLLLELAEEYTAQKHLFRKLISLYRQQALDSLYYYMLKQPEYAQYEEILLNRRNRKWVPVIEKYIWEKPVFIAVGAGHLPGEQGLINLLREKGYTVKPLR